MYSDVAFLCMIFAVSVTLVTMGYLAIAIEDDPKTLKQVLQWVCIALLASQGAVVFLMFS